MILDSDAVTQIAEKYRVLGISKGSEILLSRSQAIEFINDLVSTGATIYGISGWRVINKDKGWIVQDLSADFAVPEEIIKSLDNSRVSGSLACQYVSSD